MMIECRAFLGGTKIVPAEKLAMRPAAYGVIVHEGKVLLITNRRTGKYFFPGGGVDQGERLHDALHREVREETGIQVEIVELIQFHEDFFYYDPLDLAFQSYGFFYACNPLTFDLLADEEVDDTEAEKPRWVEIASLQEEDLQLFATGVLDFLKRLA